MFKKIIFAVFVLSAAAQLVFAHDAWIGNRDGALVMLYGHDGKTEAYDPNGVQAAKAFDAKGQDIAVEIVKGKDGVTLSPKGSPALVTAVYDGGYWVQTTDGWKKMKKTEAKGKFDVVEAVKSKKCCKSFLSAGDAYGKQVGQFFEIVPQKDPTTLKSGDTLPVKVLLEGKPFEGAVVATGGDHAADSKEAVKTDKGGMANVKIEKSGPQLVKANDKISIKDDPDADAMYLSSTITFDAH